MSDITLKPCPYCQSDNVCISISPEMQDGRRFYYGFCYDCTMVTPEVSNEEGEGIAEEQAAEAWNSLPRHLHWTTETPTEPGWYWWRPEKNIVPHMVYVVWESTMRSVQKDRMFVLYPHSDVEFAVDERPGQWAGPIPEPEEPR